MSPRTLTSLIVMIIIIITIIISSIITVIIIRPMKQGLEPVHLTKFETSANNNVQQVEIML